MWSSTDQKLFGDSFEIRGFYFIEGLQNGPQYPTKIFFLLVLAIYTINILRSFSCFTASCTHLPWLVTIFISSFFSL